LGCQNTKTAARIEIEKQLGNNNNNIRCIIIIIDALLPPNWTVKIANLLIPTKLRVQLKQANIKLKLCGQLRI
jgi:hypothetical protein